MHGTQGPASPRWGETGRGLSGLPHGAVSFHREGEANLHALTSLRLAGQLGNTNEASHQGGKSGPPATIVNYGRAGTERGPGRASVHTLLPPGTRQGHQSEAAAEGCTHALGTWEPPHPGVIGPLEKPALRSGSGPGGPGARDHGSAGWVHMCSPRSCSDMRLDSCRAHVPMARAPPAANEGVFYMQA